MVQKDKRVTIIVESLDSENNTYIQPLHEQRYSLDHFMRAIDYEKSGEEEKVKKAILSAIGHLQRSYSDLIEWMLMTVKEEYLETLSTYTNEQINQGFPQYYTEIRPALDKITDIVNEYKVNKSIESVSSADILSKDAFTALNVIAEQLLPEDIVDKLSEYIKLLRKHENTLIEIKKRDGKKTIKEKFLIPTVSAIVSAIVSGIVVALMVK